MRKWLRWLGLVAFAGVVVNGCGGSGGNVNPGDDGGEGGTVDATGSSSSGGSDGSGNDVNPGMDSSSGGGDANSFDASLDISIPDGFTMPETGMDAGPDVDASMVIDSGCKPNGILCNGNIAKDCMNGVETDTDCAQLNEMCATGYGCVVCQPGTGSCNGNVGKACKPDGSGYTTNNCDPTLGEMCDPNTGRCDGDCANLPDNSYIGCEYYAVTMSNSQLSQATFPFSISISNTSGAKTANITITGPNNTNISDTILPSQLKEYKPGWVNSLSNPGSPGSSILVKGGAYHIKSTEPVTVYQFNPRDYQIGGSNSYTNDASLLIPVNAMTGNYYVMAGATWDFMNIIQFPGNVDIIATADNTQVTYKTPGGTNTIQVGSTTLTTTGGTVTLNHGDVLQIASTGNGTAAAFGSDQSGATITATAPIEVFGGTDCTNMPATVQYCDHIEEIVFPIETLRTDYLVTLPWNDNAAPEQWVKIVATAAGTTFTYDPPQAAAPASLNAGQAGFFHATQHFHVTANHPFIVGQFMEGQNNFGATCFNTFSQTCGDPASSVAIATAQFRDSYQFVAPETYYENWVNVIAPSGAQVKVDGTLVPANAYVAIGNSGYGVAHVSIPCTIQQGNCNPVHVATGNVGFGIEVYGYGAYTSYWYPGGLNLTRQ